MNRNLRDFLILLPVVLAAQFICLGGRDVNLHVGLALGHSFLLYVGIFLIRGESNRRLIPYFGGYFLLALLTAGYADKGLLLILFSMLYAATYQSGLLFGYFLIAVLSFVVLPLYAFAEFSVGLLLYSGVYALHRRRKGILVSGFFLWGGLLVAFLLMPLLHLCAQSTPQDVARTWQSSAQVREAIGNSLFTATIASVIGLLFGVPLAYGLARSDFAGRRLLITLVDVPILVPQPIVALALLQFLGEKSTLGHYLEAQFGLRFAGAFPGIIAAQVFVSSPFLIRSALTAFEEVDERLEKVARTLGASARHAFWLVALPLAARGILAGFILAWSRAISEFGSVLILAEYPETAPVMVYHLFIRYGLHERTLPAVVLLVLVCLWAFIGLHVLRRAWGITTRKGAARVQ